MAQLRFFVYGPLMSGEADHPKLGGAELVGPARTVAGYALVELGPLAGLVAEGTGAVVGEVYRVEGGALAKLLGEHPALYRLGPVRLDDGSTAESLVLDATQARGKRRIRSGDWRSRLGAPPPKPPSPLVRWARARHTKG
jgi:gamma-glutamylcyclotransferase (GGCT)/AIG2-like uncharacterized protein YtfP